MLKKTRGIGLLELMLSLAIIAILLVMAIRYYQSASNSQKVTQALDMFNAVKSGAKNYFTTTHSVNVSMSSLVSGGYLPSSYLDKGSTTSSAHVSPWGTAFTITGSGGGTGGSGVQFTVTMDAVPLDSCTQIVSRIKGTLSTASGEKVSPDSDCKSDTAVEVTYSLG